MDNIERTNLEENMDNQEDTQVADEPVENVSPEKGSEMEAGSEEKETMEETIPDYEKIVADLEKKLDEKEKQCSEYLEMLQRMAAEFDNYKKRTARERQNIYDDAARDVIAAFLPVIDNFERALALIEKEENSPIKEGIEMVYRQIKEVLEKLNVEEIKAVGEVFDPRYHNAIMHIEDDSFGENEIVEEYQKGYICGDKVLRHSTVKVAN